MAHRLPPGVSLRRARPEDAEALAHLHLDVWDDAYTGLMAQSILDERRARTADRIRAWEDITAQEVPPLVALDGTHPIGFAKAAAARDHDVDIALELWSLYVRAAWWGTGVGNALFAAEVGDSAAYLWVLHGNARAIHYYERQGFRLDGTEDELDDGLHVRMVRHGT